MANKLKVVGTITALAGIAIGIINNVVEEKKTEEKLQEMVDKKFAEREEKEEGS